MERTKHTIDATGKIGGRLASEIAKILMGKNKPTYRPDVDTGDMVEVTNVDKMIFSGKKTEQKIYYRHSLYPGGIKTKQLKDRLAKEPERLLRDMVNDMLPKNRLRSGMIKRLTFVKSDK